MRAIVPAPPLALVIPPLPALPFETDSGRGVVSFLKPSASAADAVTAEADAATSTVRSARFRRHAFEARRRPSTTVRVIGRGRTGLSDGPPATARVRHVS